MERRHFWVPVSPPPAHSRAPLAVPSFWKVWLRPWVLVLVSYYIISSQRCNNTSRCRRLITRTWVRLECRLLLKITGHCDPPFLTPCFVLLSIYNTFNVGPNKAGWGIENLKGQQHRWCVASLESLTFESQPKSDTLQWFWWLWNHLEDENGDG